MNLKMVGKYLGLLVWAEGIMMLPAALVGLLYGEVHSLWAILASMGLCGLLGLALFLLCRRENAAVYPREGFVVAGLGWLLVSLLGAFPYFFGGALPSYFDAYLESVAGFTTTGTFSPIDVEAWPRGLLFWRSFSQWLGGIGVLSLILAVVRMRGGGGFSLNVLRAEATGPRVGKIMPKTQESVRSLYLIYAGLSALNLLFLLLGGMPVFDAFCTMFGTAGTGGFGIKNDSMASYSPYLQGVSAVFMLLFGVNYTLYYLLLHREWRSVLRDEELRLYGGVVGVSVVAVTASLLLAGLGGVGKSLHHAAFMVSSVITSTGLSIGDYGTWPAFARSILFILMILGAMSNSTAGGIKMARLLILSKSIRGGLHRMMHPRSVVSMRLNGKPLSAEVYERTQLYLFMYCSVMLVSFLLISVDGFPLEDNLTAVIACLNNIGPGFGLVGRVAHFGDYSAFSKLVLSVNMLLGRLEIFPVLLLLSPGTWSRKN